MRRHSRPLGFALIALAALIVFAGCGTSTDEGSAGDRPRVAASTPLIAEFSSIVAGDDADVIPLIPAGIEIHSYEPAPAIVASIAQADIIFVNGYNLEEGLLDVILENVSADAAVVPVAAGLTLLQSGEAPVTDAQTGQASTDEIIRASGDPHLWLDVSNAIHYVEQIRDHLVELDPEQASGYRERAGAYIEELQALDAEIRATVASIPAGARELVVLHDAYQYFAAAYGLELSAALLPAGAQQSAGAAAVVDLINLIEERGITAIYREPQFGGSALDAIAAETGVPVLILYSTYAGDVDSYVELMRANAAALLEGLGGSTAARLEGPSAIAPFATATLARTTRRPRA